MKKEPKKDDKTTVRVVLAVHKDGGVDVLNQYGCDEALAEEDVTLLEGNVREMGATPVWIEAVVDRPKPAKAVKGRQVRWS